MFKLKKSNNYLNKISNLIHNIQDMHINKVILIKKLLNYQRLNYKISQHVNNHKNNNNSRRKKKKKNSKNKEKMKK